MDMEKYTSGKVYFFFEWAFKLVVWNLLSLLIIFIISGLPLFCFYKVQEQYTITELQLENDSLTVTLQNEETQVINEFKKIDSITFFEINNNFISFEMDQKKFAIPNENYLKNIETLYFKNNILYAKYMEFEYQLGDIFDSELDIEKSHINGYNSLVISLKNGVLIEYGNVFGINATLSSVLIFIFIVLAILTFIPTYATIFSMVKIFGENASNQTFMLYFDILWDNLKSLYKIELVIVPILSLLSFSCYYYYLIISGLTSFNFLISLSYNIILITIILIIIFILNLPLTIGYFRMNTRTILRFTLIMLFKNILISIASIIVLIIPIILSLMNSIFIPLWFLVGFSLPALIMYQLTRKKYRYLAKNINNEKEFYDEIRN